MPGFERTINGGPPRIIGCVIGGAYATEEAFLTAMGYAAKNITRGLRVLWVAPDGSATTYARTDVPVPTEGEPAGPLYGAPQEVVSATNGRWLFSEVVVGVWLQEGEPIISWKRRVGVTAIDNENESATFGLVEDNSTFS